MKIRVEPSVILLLASMLLVGGAAPLATLLAVTVHECGHLLAARCLGVRIKLLQLDLLGARLYPATPLASYKAEAALAAGGPLFSFLLLPVCHLLPLSLGSALRESTLALGLFNLLPIAGFDGGRLLSCALAAHLPPTAAARITGAASYLSLLFLWSVSACLTLREGLLPSLSILSASLFARLFLPSSPSTDY